MEIIFEEKKKTARKNYPRYKVSITFMQGDADGYANETAEFKVNETDDLKRLVFALECCNAAYQNGRGGSDEYHGLLEYDAFFVEDVEETETIKKLNPNGIFIEHPYDSNCDCSTSFDGYKVEYIDEDGTKTPIKFKFDDIELARIEECKKFDG